MTELKVSIFPIERVAVNWIGDKSENNFDAQLLPFQVCEGVTFENIAGLISKDEFDYCRRELGTETTKHLEKIRFAFVHRFPRIELDPSTGSLVLEHEAEERSLQLVQETIACLRLIRPINQHAQSLCGTILPDGHFAHFRFDNPIPYLMSLPNQQLFAVRTKDITDLKFYMPHFRSAMAAPAWKFRMAIEMFQSGYFQQSHWKAKFFLWSAALESLFTSQGSRGEHSGSLVAKERIKSFLGPSTTIYPSGELSEFDPDPNLTVSDVIDEIYCLRNHIAHGDKIPVHYARDDGRPSINGSIERAEMLLEAISSIIRQSVLKILKDGLLTHFTDAVSSEAYFGALGLTKSELKKRKLKPYHCPS
jgi:hypothetical protein